ncbi:secreted frizzled-related protein 2-like [Eublepharis macularius]|uniref:Secreted frizzled-related protein 2-like n=1 Tax=Eublepharis macularius TaxID=481883 RepID=A0AA97JUU8_EUBMA|nr:secreted frizzled-related protein 2-like [Eublepharis macularius]
MLPAAFGLVFVLMRVAVGLDLGLSTKCVAIPKEMSICHDVGYSEMRLPNLMGHTTLAEVVPESAGWQRLVQTGCHPYSKTFLCALFAPVCLDTFIQPCRSMCVAIRDSCAPVLGCHGSHWPSSLDCDRFPADEDMCLGSLGKEQKHIVKVFPKPACQICPAVEEFLTHKGVSDLFCTNNFVTKVKLSRKRTVLSIQEYNVDCQAEFITPGLVLPYDACRVVEEWFLVNEGCIRKMTPTHRPMIYLIAGTTEESNVLIHHVYRWQRWNSQLTLSIWKRRQHKCT